jgi:Uma2 family endonuclease
MVTEIKTGVSLEEYYRLEYDSKTKHEYINGEIVPMPYTSENHGLIASNIHGALFICLKDRKNHRLYIADRMLYVAKDAEEGNTYYPDLMILNEEPVFKSISTNMQATTNPAVVIEILSDSNADNDLIEKLTHYKTISSLRQYLIFWQNKMQVETFTRINEKEWLDVVLTEKDGAVKILDCELLLKDIYDKVI